MIDSDIVYEFEENDIIDDIFPDTVLESLQTLFEADKKEYKKAVNKLKMEICNVDEFVKVNNCKEITNPITFIKDGYPTPDGLLSNEIFGITKEDRSGTFAYIDLGGVFLDPSCYKAWYRIDSRIKNIIHQTDTYIVNSKGEIEESPKGSNGVKFLKDNIDKIDFKRNTSLKRDLKIDYLIKNKDRMFITKYLVIPAYFRDVNSNGKRVGIGSINKSYASLITSVRSLNSTTDYGFDNTGAISGRIQELLLLIYDWYVGNRNDSISDEGVGMSKKKGIIKRANLNKTADYSSRLIISAPELKVETVNDIMVTLERSALPLAAAIADFYPFMLFHLKRFFENEFGGDSLYPVMTSPGKIEYLRPKDPLIEFSDERLTKELRNFLHGYTNRFIPIEVPLEGYDKPCYMVFKGRGTPEEKIGDNPESIYNRRLTWCDVFYMAATEATKDKTILITRFPIDSYLNQFPTKVVISSTKVTEPMYIDGIYYPFYPMIREEDIGSNTGNKFVDTMMISNLYLGAIGGDYDGDTVTVKGNYTTEANEELEKFIHSKSNFIDVGGSNVRVTDKDALQSMYELTYIIPEDKDKLIKPVF